MMGIAYVAGRGEQVVASAEIVLEAQKHMVETGFFIPFRAVAGKITLIRWRCSWKTWATKGR